MPCGFDGDGRYMRNIDYYYLSKLNLKRNKTRTRISISILTIGLLLSSLALFTIMAFYFGSLGLDYDTNFNSINISHDFEILENEYSMTDYQNEYNRLGGINNIVNCSIISIRSSSTNPVYIYYDNNAISSDMKNINVYSVNNFDAKYIEDYANNNTKKPFLISGKNTINKNEIMLSKNFLILNGLSEDILGKEISIRSYYHNITGTYYKDGNDLVEDTFSGYYDFFTDYKVVGIFNSQYKRENGVSVPMGPYGADILLSSESVYWANINISHNEKFLDFKFVFDKPIEKIIEEAKNKNLVFSSNPMNSSEDILYFKSFNYTNNAYNILKTRMTTDKFSKVVSVDPIFDGYASYHAIVNSIMKFLSVIGVLILIVAILNIFNAMKYDISTKSRNIGILKTVGFKDKNILKLKLFEFYNYLFTSMVVSFFVGLVLSIILTIFMNNMLNYEAIGFDVKAKMDFWYYFIAYFAVLLLIFIVSYIYILIITKKIVKNKPITLLKKR